MAERRSNLNAPVGIALVMGALLACSGNDGVTIDDEQVRQDVLYCEDAVAHLEACCNGFVAPQLACVHYRRDSRPNGCDSTGTVYHDIEDPALDLAESKCIQARSCQVLVATGICTRAQGARAQKSGSSHYEESGSTKGTEMTYATPHAKVCP